MDPGPDPEASWRERERLFALPRSTWDDYDRTVLSKGGGVGPRGSKRIPVPLALRARLGTPEQMGGQELVRAILCMGYLAHPRVLRQLRLAPRAFETPVCEADLLYPPIGRGPEAIRYSSADLTPPSDGTPLSVEGPLHPRYAEKIS